MKDSPVERYLRDSRIMAISEVGMASVSLELGIFQYLDGITPYDGIFLPFYLLPQTSYNLVTSVRG